MEIFYFSLGIVTVVILLTVVGMFQVKSRINELNNIVEGLNDQLRDLYDITGREIPTHVSDFESRVDREMSEIYSSMDSRLDKLEARINRQIEFIEREIQATHTVQIKK
jgi:predicted  nucleic acid-binding Zn ribbon protein